MKIIIGIPAFNEEANIGELIGKLKELSYEIIVCDDGSTDETYNISKDQGAIVVKHKKNLGYGAAIRSIFIKAKEMDCDVLVTFDGDGQHNIKDIEKVIEPITNNNSDLVIGSRFLDSSEKEVPQYRKVGIKIITSLTNATMKEKLTDSQSGFRAYAKHVLNELNPSEEGMGISTEILIKASTKKFRISEVPIKILYEGNTSTHNPIRHGSSVIISTIKYTSIQRPLTFYGIPAVIFLIIGSTFSYLAVQYYVEIGRLNTNLTVVGASSFLIGIVLMMTAILLFSLVTVVKENKN